MMTLLEACMLYSKYTLEHPNCVINDALNTWDETARYHLNQPFVGDIMVNNIIYQLNICFEHYGQQKDREVDYMMGLLTPNQHTINQHFWTLYYESPTKATQFLYNLGKRNQYIKTEKIKRNQQFYSHSLIITINLSKEEKDNKQIAQMAKKVVYTYPKCVLCYENVGYKGEGQQPPRSTLRVAELTLDGEPWFMQYSPYPYFEEHAIFIDKTHRPMKVDGQTITQLIEIVDLFPDYFVGSNAAMPIIGGSILSHAHFQGGKRPDFPLMSAQIESTLRQPLFPSVSISTLVWPTFVLRLSSEDATALKQCIIHYMNVWTQFEAKDIGLVSTTNGEQHHGVAPIIHKHQGTYIAHLIFRSNITDEQHPEGLFHAHPEFHHIKKEGIGLIEAMGMFILPGRLMPVLNEYTQLTNLNDFYALANRYDIHRVWLIQNLIPKTFHTDDLHKQFVDALGEVCYHILENISVFKNDDLGKKYKAQFLFGHSGDNHV